MTAKQNWLLTNIRFVHQKVSDDFGYLLHLPILSPVPAQNLFAFRRAFILFQIPFTENISVTFMNTESLQKTLTAYLICFPPDIFVHFHNALLNLLIYSYHIFFLHPFGANLSTESFDKNAVLISLSALSDIFNFTDSGV